MSEPPIYRSPRPYRGERLLFSVLRATTVINIVSPFVFWVIAIALGNGRLAWIAAVELVFGLMSWGITYWYWTIHRTKITAQ